MKKVALCVGVLMLMGLNAWATTVSPCVEGSLSSYIALGKIGCSIDDKVFSNFKYVGTQSGGATGVTAGGIDVSPLSADPSDPGVLFAAGWGASSGQKEDSLISFLVSVASGAATIKDASIVELGSAPFGTGVASIAETLCVGGTKFPCTKTITRIKTIDGGGFIQLQDNVIFSPTGQVFAVKDILVRGGTNGEVSLSGVQDNFSQIPEPATLILFGSGLVGLGGLVRRRFRKS